MEEVTRTNIHSDEWTVQRHGKIYEVQMEDGSIRYNVIIQDEGRSPFLRQWFNDRVPAQQFFDRIRTNLQEVRIQRVHEISQT